MRLLSADLATHELTHVPLPTTDVVSGTPTTALAPLAELGPVEIGLWEMSLGTAVDTEVDEVFVVVAGSGAVEFTDGEVIDLRAGVVVRLTAGEQTRWTVTETLRKVYVAL